MNRIWKSKIALLLAGALILQSGLPLYAETSDAMGTTAQTESGTVTLAAAETETLEKAEDAEETEEAEEAEEAAQSEEPETTASQETEEETSSAEETSDPETEESKESTKPAQSEENSETESAAASEEEDIEKDADGGDTAQEETLLVSEENEESKPQTGNTALTEETTEAAEETTAAEETLASEAEQITYTEDGIPIIPESMLPAQSASTRRSARARAGSGEDGNAASDSTVTDDGYFSVSVAPRAKSQSLTISYLGQDGESHEVTFSAGQYEAEAVYTAEVVNYPQDQPDEYVYVGDDNQYTFYGSFLKVRISRMIIRAYAVVVVSGQKIEGTYSFEPESISKDTKYSLDLNVKLTEKGAGKYLITLYNDQWIIADRLPFVLYRTDELETWQFNTSRLYAYTSDQAAITLSEAAPSEFLFAFEEQTESSDSGLGHTAYNALLFYCAGSNLENVPSTDAEKLEYTLQNNTTEFGTQQTVKEGKKEYPYTEAVALEYHPQEAGDSKEAFREKINQLARNLGDNDAITDKDNCVTFISWSGHGSFDPDVMQSYLSLGDTKKDCLSGAELRQILSELPGRVIVLTDACFSGGLLNMDSAALASELDGAEETDASGSEAMYAEALTTLFAEDFITGGSGSAAVFADNNDGSTTDKDGTNAADDPARYQMLLAAQSVQEAFDLGSRIGSEITNNFCLAFAYDGTTIGANDKSYNTFSADYDRNGVITMSEMETIGEYSAFISTPVYYPSGDSVNPLLHCLIREESDTQGTAQTADGGQSGSTDEDGKNTRGASFEVKTYDHLVKLTQSANGQYQAVVSFEAENKLSESITLCAYAGLQSTDGLDHRNVRPVMESAFLNLSPRYGCAYVQDVTLSANSSGVQQRELTVPLETADLSDTLYIYLQLKKGADAQSDTDAEGTAQTGSSESPRSAGTQFMVLRVTMTGVDQSKETLTKADIESLAIEVPSSAQYNTTKNPYHVSLSENADGEPSPFMITYRFAEDRSGAYYENRYADCVATMSVYQVSSETGTTGDDGTGTGTGRGGADPGDGTFMLNLFAGRRMHWRRQDLETDTTSGEPLSYGTGEISWDLRVTGSDGKRKLIDPGTYLLKLTATYNSAAGSPKTPEAKYVYLKVTKEPNTTSDKLLTRLYFSDRLLSLWFRDGSADSSVTAAEIAAHLKDVVTSGAEGVYEVEDVSIYGLTDADNISESSIWGSALSDGTKLRAVADNGKYLATRTVLEIPADHYKKGYRFSGNLRLNLGIDSATHQEVHFASDNPAATLAGAAAAEAASTGRYLIIYQLHPLKTEAELLKALMEGESEGEELSVFVDGQQMNFTALSNRGVYNGTRIGKAGETQVIILYARTESGEVRKLTDEEFEWTVPDDAKELIFEIKQDGFANCQQARYSFPVKPASEGRGFVLESAPEKTVYVLGEQPDLSTAKYSYNGAPVPASEVKTNWEQSFAKEASAYAVTVSYMGQTLKDAFDLIYYATQMMSKADGVSFSRSRSGLYESVDPDSVYLAVTPNYIDYATSADGQELLAVNYALHFYRMDGNKPDPSMDTEVYPVSGSFSKTIAYPSELANGYDSFDKMAFVSAVQGANALSVTAEEGGLRLSGGSSGEVTVTFRLKSQPTPSGSSSGGSSASDRAKGWVRVGTLRGDSYTYGWKYLGMDGRYVTGTRTPGADGAPGELIPAWVQTPAGGWYAFDENGWLITGWLYDPAYSGWFYIDETAGAYLGWHEIGGKWYYFDDAESAGLWQSYVARMAENRLIDGLYQVGPDGDWDGTSHL